MLKEEGAEVTVDTTSASPGERDWLKAGQYLQLVSVDRAGSDHKDDQDKVLPSTSSFGPLCAIYEPSFETASWQKVSVMIMWKIV